MPYTMRQMQCVSFQHRFNLHLEDLTQVLKFCWFAAFAILTNLGIFVERVQKYRPTQSRLS